MASHALEQGARLLSHGYGKAAEGRLEKLREMEYGKSEKHTPLEAGGSSGGGGATGSWGTPKTYDEIKAEKEDRQQARIEKYGERKGGQMNKLENEYYDLKDESNFWRDQADGQAGFRETVLSNLTVKGIIKGKAEDFLGNVLDNVRERYDKASDKDKFNVGKESVEAFKEELMKLFEKKRQ